MNTVDNVIPGWTLDALNEQGLRAPSMKVRTTDAQGRFDFTGLPVDCRFWIHLRAKDFPWQSFHAATTDGPQPDHDSAPVLTGDMKVVLHNYRWTSRSRWCSPTRAHRLPRSRCRRRGPVSTLETTDDQGRVTLEAPGRDSIGWRTGRPEGLPIS